MTHKNCEQIISLFQFKSISRSKLGNLQTQSYYFILFTIALCYASHSCHYLSRKYHCPTHGKTQVIMEWQASGVHLIGRQEVDAKFQNQSQQEVKRNCAVPLHLRIHDTENTLVSVATG